MRYLLLFSLIIFFSSCESEKEKLLREIRMGEEKLFNDSTKRLNTDEANLVFANYLEYAGKYRNDTNSAAFLFKAGDISNGLKRPKEAIEIYQRLMNEYPDYRKTPSALFVQAFIYETALLDNEKAKVKYREFLKKYPEHKLAPSAQASLDQLEANLTDEQLIRMFEARNDSLQARP